MAKVDPRGWLELTSDAKKQFADVLKALASMSNRAEASTAISDATMTLVAMADRIANKNHGFREYAATAVASDDDDDDVQTAQMDRRTAEVSLLDVLDDEQVSASPEEVTLYDEIMAMHDREAALRHLHVWVQGRKVIVLRSMINYIWYGANTPWEMMKRALAITRRYYKAKIKGISMTEVARLLEEKSRCAAVSARERDIHDELLIRWGIKAPKAADPGLKPPSTCLKNKLAAMGNKNRAKPLSAASKDAAKPNINREPTLSIL